MLLLAKALDKLEKEILRRTPVDAHECLACVRRRYPTLDDTQVALYTEGWDFIVIIVNRTEVFRFPRTRLSAHRLFNESQFLHRFAPHSSVQVPHMQIMRDASFRFPYALYPVIYGVPLMKDLYKGLSAQEVHRIAKDLGAFLSSLHAMSSDGVERGFSGAGGVAQWKKQIQEIQRFVFPHVTKEEGDWIIAVFKRFFKILINAARPSAIIHGDLSTDHILVDPMSHTLTGIIDFGDVDRGDPAYDFQFERVYDMAFVQEVYTHYAGVRDEEFDNRRRVYEHRLPILQLKSALKAGDKGMVVMRTQELREYIKNNPCEGGGRF